LAFEDALKIAAPGFTITSESVSFDGTQGEALEALDKLLRRYRSIIMPEREMTAEQAAEHLGIGIDQFKTYAYRQKKIAGRIVGKTTLFSERELNRFDLTRRRRASKGDKPDSEPEE
jgi:hypothetical protein